MPSRSAAGDGHSELPSRIVRDAQNNIGALLVAGVAALLVGIIVLVAERRGARRSTIGDIKAQVILLLVTAGLVGIGAWLLASDKILDLHGWSAVAMFGVLAVASIFDGAWLLWINRGNRPKTSRRWKALGILYITVGAAMVVVGAFIKFGVRKQWDHRTLVLEFVEIGLFAAMWAVQSIERWGKALQAEASSDPRRVDVGA